MQYIYLNRKLIFYRQKKIYGHLLPIELHYLALLISCEDYTLSKHRHAKPLVSLESTYFIVHCSIVQSLCLGRLYSFDEHGLSWEFPLLLPFIDWSLPIPHSSLLHFKSSGLRRAMGIYGSICSNRLAQGSDRKKETEKETWPGRERGRGGGNRGMERNTDWQKDRTAY